MVRRYDLLVTEPEQSEHDYADVPCVSSLSKFVEAIHPYIAGCAGKITARIIHCPVCVDALGSKKAKSKSSFLNKKDMGGLFKSSDGVLDVCKLTELKVRQLLRTTQGKVPQGELCMNIKTYFEVGSV